MTTSHLLDAGARRARRRHWRRHLKRFAFSAAAFFFPHAGKVPPRAGTAPMEVKRVAEAAELKPSVTVYAGFRPPDWLYDDIIREAANRYRVDPALVRAVIRAESDFDPLAVSKAGAQGLMQLMPELAQELGVQDPFDPRENIMAGTRYLAQLLQAYDGNLELTLAGYNAGPGAVDQYAGVPPFPETQQYIKSITNQLQ
jgi:soluble lytic murein transglycosylase-like protein